MRNAPARNIVPHYPTGTPKPVLLENAAPGTQASRIFAKFGGARKLHKALKELGDPHYRNLASIYRWQHPKERGGSAGIVPTSALPSILLAARHEGIVLTAADLDPRPTT